MNTEEALALNPFDYFGLPRFWDKQSPNALEAPRLFSLDQITAAGEPEQQDKVETIFDNVLKPDVVQRSGGDDGSCWLMTGKITTTRLELMHLMRRIVEETGCSSAMISVINGEDVLVIHAQDDGTTEAYNMRSDF